MKNLYTKNKYRDGDAVNISVTEYQVWYDARHEDSTVIELSSFCSSAI